MLVVARWIWWRIDFLKSPIHLTLWIWMCCWCDLNQARRKYYVCTTEDDTSYSLYISPVFFLFLRRGTSDKWGKTSVFNNLWRHFADKFQHSLFDYSELALMMAILFFVCHLFPGSSGIGLCGRPQGTEGLSASRLQLTCHILAVQFAFNRYVLKLFPRVSLVW